MTQGFRKVALTVVDETGGRKAGLKDGHSKRKNGGTLQQMGDQRVMHCESGRDVGAH